MSSASKIFLDQKKDGVEIPISLVLKALQDGLNNIILNSYEAHEVSKNELNKFPLIRNRSKVESLNYNPCCLTIGNDFGDSISAQFNIFCTSEEAQGFPQDTFKFKSPKSEVYHQRRHIDCLTNLNCDAKNHLPNVDDSKNKFMILSIGDDVVGQKIMHDLAVHLQNVLQTEVYYQRTDLNNEITPINQTKIASKNKIKP